MLQPGQPVEGRRLNVGKMRLNCWDVMPETYGRLGQSALTPKKGLPFFSQALSQTPTTSAS